MKKIITTAILAATTLAASAQIHPTIDSLFARLNVFDFYRDAEKYQTNQGNGISIHQVFQFYKTNVKSSDPIVERIRLKENSDADLAIADIRRTLDALVYTAPESYRMETHMGGRDTVKYAINLSPEPGRMIDLDGMSYMSGASESVTFSHRTEANGKGESSYLAYGKQLYAFPYEIDSARLGTGAESLHRSFDHVAFKQQVIDNVLTGKDLKRREIHWRHPNVPLSDKATWDEYMSAGYSGVPGTDSYESAGETKGTIYFLPTNKKEQADELLRQLDKATYAYVNEHRYQIYTYYFDVKYQNRGAAISNLLCARYSSGNDDSYYDSDFDIRLYSDDEGYYILVLNTTGQLWIPKEFTKLKSYVDGKKVYIK